MIKFREKQSRIKTYISFRILRKKTLKRLLYNYDDDDDDDDNDDNDDDESKAAES